MQSAGNSVCLGAAMSGHTVRVCGTYACAYCSEPLSFTSRGINAWRVSGQFVCTEFCADGILADNAVPISASLPPQTEFP
jgi:hypothetical protein